MWHLLTQSSEGKMNTGLLIFAAVATFVMVVVGATAVNCMARMSHKLLLLGNTAAGGVLIGVSLVHMLADNVGEMDSWGMAFNRAIGGSEDEPFPLGFALAGFGFFLIFAIEQLGGGHDHEHPGQEHAVHEHEREHKHGQKAREPAGGGFRDASEGFDTLSESEESVSSASSHGSDVEAVSRSKRNVLRGLSTFFGVAIHSAIESVAIGSTKNTAALASIIAAVLFHKGFAAFAVGSSIQGVTVGRQGLFWALILTFAAIGPVGILLGALCGNMADGQASAALQCFASGTLIEIGISEMLVPGLNGSKSHRKRRLFAAVVGFIAMALLAAWA
uniref:Uncharacterized protein n=1 Tax=Alexandrium catenella TaxID=2925 RepID=A0A7S1WKP6_ALECA